MTFGKGVLAAMALLVVAVMSGGPLPAGAQQQPMAAPKASVPEIFTIQGEFVRVAYNNEGFATLGYRIVQDSVGDEWVLLDTGITVRRGVKSYTLKREHLTLKTPDGKTHQLATQREFNEAGGLRGLNMRARVMRDSINYFPVDVSRPCAIRFFAELGGAGPDLAYGEVELSSQRACLGRLYFRVPGGIKVGQYWLKIQFANSVVEAPFRIFTDEEEKQFRKQWQDFKKEHEATLK